MGAVYFGKPFIDRIISDSSTPVSLIIGTLLTVSVIGLMIYLSYKINWNKIIGSWFPWTVDKSDGNTD